MSDWQEVPGSVTAPAGFRASGVQANIRRTKKDVAVIASDFACASAGCFTTNRVKGAPVVVSQEHVARGQVRAVVVNSGIANVSMGARGLADARRMAELTAELLGIDPFQVGVASTGVIGMPLPMDRVESGIRAAVAGLSPDGGGDAAQAIMTTDLRPKQIAVRFEIGGKPVTIGAIAKGSGMICPNMATMLAFLTTDAAIGPQALQHALRASVEHTYNMVSVDGDTSTSDMVIAMANGRSGCPEIREGTPEFALFAAALDHVNTYLAKEIARDGEGATKLIEVEVTGAATPSGAKLAALAIVKSPLVKTAVFGADANWGRIMCAAGYSGAEFEPERATLHLGDIAVYRDGMGLPFDEEAARKYLEQPEVVIRLDLGGGPCRARAWGCDLTYDYVKINGSYRT